jgi:FKBP-type peptidyl-prolyl cis-trans isomerase
MALALAPACAPRCRRVLPRTCAQHITAAAAPAVPRRAALGAALGAALAAAPGASRAGVLDGAAAALLQSAARTSLDRGSDDSEVAGRVVEESPDGLAWTDLRLGDGPLPRTGDLVVAHVRGFLPDGSLFEDTAARGGPLVFTAGITPPGVCEGLERGLLSMRAGGRRLLAVPSALGFGPGGAAGSLRRIPGNSALRYEVELLRCGAAGDAGLACCTQPNWPCDAPAAFAPAEAGAGALASPPSVDEMTGLE